ncbi:fumarylacetoacetate hydrolase family protein [Luteimicrobium sp. DT211]|uniref:fumarylacetoacetate hydrolase family protein n=1 Tax=Luteimicrobium sp. DT211 TaxID=3393412 RepID=UPI003CEB2E02
MRIVTFRRASEPSTRPGRAGVLVDDGALVLDLALADAALPSDVVGILEGGPAALDRARAAAAEPDPRALVPRGEVVLDAPVPRPGKVLGIGYNYLGHDGTRGSGAAPPARPDVFVKTANTVVGPDVPVVLPRESDQIDYEGELAVVIGTRARRVSPERALEHVAGYSMLDDVSARDWQHRGSQWALGKSFDGFAPFGPALVTADEVPDPQALDLEVAVNGEVTARSSTARMIHPVAALVAYVSEVMTLEPGDVIATGTPQKLPEAEVARRWLAPGDRVDITIGGLGTLGTTFVGDDARPPSA